MATTFDLIVEVGALVADIMEAGGEVTPEQDDRLTALLGAGEIAHKIEVLHAVVRRLRAEASHLKVEERRIYNRRQSTDKQADHLAHLAGELLLAHEHLTGEHKVKTTTGSAWLGESQAVQFDWDLLPEAFIEQRPSVLKAALKDALKAGQEIPGASLETKRGIRWR
jgi:hypothetical protein